MDPMRPPRTISSMRSGGPRRFPVRTLLLMILALVAFARLWWITHRTPRQPHPPIPVRPLSPGEGR